MNSHAPESCASCAKMDCALSHASRRVEPVAAKTAYLLDEVWPEHRAFVDAQARPTDQKLAPALPFSLGARRYDWGEATRAARLATLQRHLAMRQVARARGAVRQAAYLKVDEAVALALAAQLDHRAQHVVLSQTFLPFLWRAGVLGGRTFDVLLTRAPLATLHARLDALHARHPGSETLHDFRAPAALVDAETEALAQARRLITPHHALAEQLGERAVWLDWQRPAQRLRRAGNRVAFLGPVIARQGAHEARELSRALPTPLIVFGAELEGVNFWGETRIERRALDADWLDDLGAILHPAAATNQPRRLLEAAVHGVRIYANAGCGLAPGQHQPLETFSAAEVANLRPAPVRLTILK